MTDSTELTTQVQPPPEQSSSQALVDLRTLAMTAASPEHMQAGLSHYEANRKTFRTWLLEQMKEGVHYGVTPGCEIVSEVRNGETWYLNRNTWYSEKQWTPSKSLYQAGAQFICDALGVIAVFDADMDAWQQLGSPKGTYVYRCRLYPKQAEQNERTLIAEGRGVRQANQKKQDANANIKMCQKSAMVNAVMSGYGLSDLFTDPEMMPTPPPHENPEQRADAPQVKPRSERADQPTLEELAALLKLWQGMCDMTSRPTGKAAWAEFAEEVGGVPRESADKRNAWTREAYDTCKTEIHRLQGTLEPEDGSV